MSAGSTEQRKLAAIMFTDTAGYGALAQCNEALTLALREDNPGCPAGIQRVIGFKLVV